MLLHMRESSEVVPCMRPLVHTILAQSTKEAFSIQRLVNNYLI